MTRKTDQIDALLGDMTDEEITEVARMALDLLGIDPIVTLVLELDPITKEDVAAALAEEEDAS